MVSLSDNIYEYLHQLDIIDHIGNAGTIYYLKELSDENLTYPQGQGVNLLARTGDAVAVINGMSLETESSSVEVWLMSGSIENTSLLIDWVLDRYADISVDIHTFDEDIAKVLRVRGFELYDTTLEYVGEKLKFNSDAHVRQLSVEELQIMSEHQDEDTAAYVGEMPLNSDNLSVFGYVESEEILSVCTLESNHYGFGNIVEPIWVFTQLECRGQGLARSCISAALHTVDSDYIVLYHAEEDNQASRSLAKSLGLRLNNICYTLAVNL